MSFENFNTTLMLVGSDAPLTIAMFERLREGSTPVLNAISVLLMLGSGLLAVVSLLVQKNSFQFIQTCLVAGPFGARNFIIDIVFADRLFHRKIFNLLQCFCVINNHFTVHFPNAKQRMTAITGELDMC